MKRILHILIILLSVTLLCSCESTGSSTNSWFIIKEFDVDIDISSSLNKDNWIFSKIDNEFCGETYLLHKGSRGSATVYRYEDSSLAHSAFQKTLFYDVDSKGAYIPDVYFFDGSIVRIGNQLVVGMNESVCDMLKELKLIGQSDSAKRHGEGNIYPSVQYDDGYADEKQMLDAFSSEGYQINSIPQDITSLPSADRRYLILNNDMSVIRLIYSCESESEADDCVDYYAGACMDTADFSGVNVLKKGKLVIVYYAGDAID